jgi:hypothetical protein
MYLAAMSGMTNAYAQSQEVLLSGLFNDVTQPIVSTMTATLLQSDHGIFQVNLIVYDQYLFRTHAIIITGCLYSSATVIHEGGRFQQSAIHVVCDQTRYLSVELAVKGKSRMMVCCQPIQKPEPGIMPGF